MSPFPKEDIVIAPFDFAVDTKSSPAKFLPVNGIKRSFGDMFLLSVEMADIFVLFICGVAFKATQISSVYSGILSNILIKIGSTLQTIGYDCFFIKW